MTDASGLRLVTLKCEKCGSLLNAGPEDVVYYCNNCDTGYELIGDKDELVPVNIDFAVPSPARDGEIIYYPFWVFDANIEISSRDTSGNLGSAIGFLKKVLGKDDRPIEKFYVPAFDTSIDNIKKLGLEFTKHQPDFDTVKKDRITGTRCSSEDAEKLADFIFLSLEAEKPDMMRQITYDLGLSGKKVVGIPFYRSGQAGFVDGILGIKI